MVYVCMYDVCCVCVYTIVIIYECIRFHVLFNYRHNFVREHC
jgi:hypothetical protein